MRRIGFAALPSQVDETLRRGLRPSVERFFASVPPFPTPEAIARLEEDTPDFAFRLRNAAPEERQRLQREARERSQHALNDLTVRWLALAARPDFAPMEKWGLFLSNVFVVAADKVRNTALLFAHHQLLRERSLGLYPDLAKAVSRSPAMIVYLDLQQSRRAAPNENFARELFELFLLGEGNYTEQDVREAARAFTGYRQAAGRFRFVAREHDNGSKTIFGRRAPFTGDQVIELAFAQPAARTHLPRELIRFYLTDRPLAAPYLETIGDWWTGTGFDLRQLAVRFFTSRLFFDPAFRGNSIKSPLHLYLGLVQDLGLDVAPLPRRLLPFFRQMGQVPYAPPNVRGWVGGRLWINSSTLAARRALVESLFAPFDETQLNADEARDVAAARAAGRQHFAVTDERLAQLAERSPEAIVQRFTEFFLPLPVAPAYRAALHDHLAAGQREGRVAPDRVRSATVALLQSPEYQLC